VSHFIAIAGGEPCQYCHKRYIAKNWNIAENCTNVTDRQTTDGRRQTTNRRTDDDIQLKTDGSLQLRIVRTPVGQLNYGIITQLDRKTNEMKIPETKTFVAAYMYVRRPVNNEKNIIMPITTDKLQTYFICLIVWVVFELYWIYVCQLGFAIDHHLDQNETRVAPRPAYINFPAKYVSLM